METVEEPKAAEEKDNTIIEESDNNVYEELQDYLARGLYPTGSTKQDKCIICKRVKNFKLIDGVLHYQEKEGPRQVVTETKTKRQILEACHDDRVGGCHFGRDRTFAKVSARFYWKGIKEDVNDWVRRHDMHIPVSCNACLV